MDTRLYLQIDFYGEYNGCPALQRQQITIAGTSTFGTTLKFQWLSPAQTIISGGKK
ncbi:MAG TPA: hypothetical protein VK666_12180 [Chryseolinea sp.]|nr:hypothetical protein [Chryseolinea sp.]